FGSSLSHTPEHHPPALRSPAGLFCRATAGPLGRPTLRLYTRQSPPTGPPVPRRSAPPVLPRVTTPRGQGRRCRSATDPPTPQAKPVHLRYQRSSAERR